MSSLIIFGALMMWFGPSDSLDAKLYYTGDQARALLQRMSAADVDAYFINELFDLIFLSSYTGLFVLSAQRLFPQRKWILVLPLVVGAADLIETLTVIGVVKFSVSLAVLEWLGIFTFIKWSVGAIVGLLILIGGLRKIR